ncbi:restriction endonuclease subunit S [Vagococcus fluvialis]|uniref:restriction endonuclease subunit S n=1 Tax=Vagococcus fluvialis TaxID=2738 RepID=UPI003B5A9FF0
MANKITKQPEIRFKEFNNDWEQRKLGEIGKTQSGIGFPDKEQGGTEGIPFFKVSDMNNQGNENEMLTANNYVSKEQIERKKWKPIEDVPAIMFAKVGAAIMLNRKRIVRSSFLLDNNTMAYIFDNSWNANFGKTMFETINLPKYAQVGALPSYNSSDIENINIIIPNKEEQEKIGTFFKNLDDTIALQNCKLEEMQLYKKAMLQKMFPKNGEKAPEIRFDGYNDDWEQRKASDIFVSVSEKNNPDLPVLSASQEKGMILRDTIGIDIKYDKKSLNTYKKVSPGQFVIHLRSFQGGFAYSKIEGITSPAYTVIDFKNKDTFCPTFWRAVLTSTTFIKKLETVTYGIRDGRSISFTDFSSLKFNVPKYNEQKKIGDFLTALDDTIALQNNKLNKLKEMKKALLQKMFV